MKTLGQTLADPTSNIHAKLAHFANIQAENEKVIARLMASGLTRERAWAEALKTARPV